MIPRTLSHATSLQRLPIDASQFKDMASTEMVLATLRGAVLEDQETIQARSFAYANEPDAIPFYSQWLPWQAILEGVAFFGSSGSGKGIALHQMMRCLLNRVGSGYRAFIWDFKGTQRQYLETLDLKCKVRYLNPLDTRGYGINFSREVPGTLEADALAADLILPYEGKVNGEAGGTFLKTAQGVFAEVIRIHQQACPENWNLADLCIACLSERNLRRLLPLSEAGQAILDDDFGAHRQGKGVMLTLRSSLRPLYPLAAAMRHSPNMTIKEWVTGDESVFVLQNYDEYKATLYPLFKWVFKKCLRTIISRPDRGERYIFCLDEVRQAPFVEDVIDLATVGRENGAGFIIASQDIEGLRRVLTKEGTGELLSCCSTQCYLQNNNPETAKVASDRFGPETIVLGDVSVAAGDSSSTDAAHLAPDKQRALIEMRLRHIKRERDLESYNSWYRGPSFETQAYERYGVKPPGTISNQASVNQTITVSARQVERALVSTSSIMHQKKAEVVDGAITTFTYIVSTFLGCWQETTLNMDAVTITRDKDIVHFEKRPEAELLLPAWTEDDLDRVGILDEPVQASVRDDD